MGKLPVSLQCLCNKLMLALIFNVMGVLQIWLCSVIVSLSLLKCSDSQAHLCMHQLCVYFIFVLCLFVCSVLLLSVCVCLCVCVCVCVCVCAYSLYLWLCHFPYSPFLGNKLMTDENKCVCMMYTNLLKRWLLIR